MEEALPILISGLALGVSILTLVLAFFWGGSIKFTKPSKLLLFYEANNIPVVNVLFYTHSTGLAGNIIRGLFIKVKRGDAQANFSDWSVKSNNGYTNFAGIKIMRDGVNLENTFLLANRISEGFFKSGIHEITLFLKSNKESSPRAAWSVNIPISDYQLTEINNGKVLECHLSADEKEYILYIRDKGKNANAELVKLMVDEMSIKLVDKK